MKDLIEISHLMDTLNIVADKISAYGKISRPYGTEDNLLVHEVHIIDYIGRHEIVTASDIVSVTYKTKGAISQTLNKLAELGLIDRTEHPDDKRKQRLILTEKGQVVYDFHREKDLVAYSRYQSRLQNVTDKDLHKANEIIKTIFKL
ncbi:MarR family winged helix-turn-helix transcriptional regulator [Vibrio taketomensis]|uniref:MarR family winged helix-turn-helix transcriptional regulator n=1 Tax=Vibrio taketomensis TaxID=2572923 RepID=UPI0013897AB1|nr:MarR family transcriptional regulator [Vibrio taketomensis]